MFDQECTCGMSSLSNSIEALKEEIKELCLRLMAFVEVCSILSLFISPALGIPNNSHSD